jgi:outer membrane cobalamin receptor
MPRVRLFTPYLLTFVLLAPGSAAGQTATPEPPRFATEVVVTPEGAETSAALVAAATTVVDVVELKSAAVTDVGELLSRLPGFSTARSTFAHGTPVVSTRGFFGGGEADYVLLLIDGVRMGHGDTGLIDWSAFPLSAIRRVEVLRGPGASIYGDAAMGGVIQLFTNRQPARGQLTGTLGTSATGTVEGVMSRGRDTAVTVAGGVKRTAGALTHSGGHELDGLFALDRPSAAARWRWTVSAYGLDRDHPGAVRRAGESAGGDPSYATDGVNPLDQLQRTNTMTALTWRHTSWPAHPSVRVSVSRRDDKERRAVLLVPGLADRQHRSVDSWSAMVSADGEQQLDAFGTPFVRFGLETGYDNVDLVYQRLSDTMQLAGSLSTAAPTRLKFAGFVSGAWQPASRLRVSGAIRHDRIVDEDAVDGTRLRNDAWSPRVGATVLAGGSVVVFGQASRAFKAATLDQLFDPRLYPDFRGGGFTISNPRLSPQRATNVEVGVRGGTTIKWDAVLYRMPVRNEIDFDARTFSYANIGRSLHRGLELSASARASLVRPSVSYSWSRVTPDGDTHQLKNVPQHTLSAAATLLLPHSWTADARVRQSWQTYLDDEQRFALETGRAIDVRVRRDGRRWAVFADMLNLFDDGAEEFGFTLTGLRGEQVPYVYPGAPRLARIGTTLSF